VICSYINLSFLYRTYEMLFSSENLCTNIICQNVHVEFLFQIFWHFEICFSIMGSFAPVSRNGYPHQTPCLHRTIQRCVGGWTTVYKEELVMEMAVKTMKRAARGAGRRRRRRGELLPFRRHHEGAPPLSPLPSWLLGSPPPWRWDPWGRQKHGFWWL
jgi:hypothetical protein